MFETRPSPADRRPLRAAARRAIACVALALALGGLTTGHAAPGEDGPAKAPSGPEGPPAVEPSPDDASGPDRPADGTQAAPVGTSEGGSMAADDDEGAEGADGAAEEDADDGTMRVSDVRKRLFEEGREARFARTTLLERAAVDALIPMLVDRARRGKDRVADLLVMARLGRMVVERWDVHGQIYLALLEPLGDARGAGAYVFRVGERAGPFLLQAPHAYFDLYTGRIAVGMFFGKRKGPRAAALFVNTLQRYERGEVRWGSRADVCRRPEHLFSLATDRFLAAMPEATVIQLHGFDEDGVPEGVDMILSNGQRETPSVALQAMADRVRKRFGDGVRLFPTQVAKLGGTTNVQGRIAGARRAGFVHVEMAKSVRKAMSKEPALRHRLARAIMGGGR